MVGESNYLNEYEGGSGCVLDNKQEIALRDWCNKHKAMAVKPASWTKTRQSWLL